MVVLYVGLGGAQFLLILSSPGTSAPFMLVSGLICLAMVPTLLSSQMTPEVVVPRAVPFRELYRLSPLGVAAVIVRGVINSIIFSMSPGYPRTRGLDPTTHATFLLVNIFPSVSTQYPIGNLADRFDRRAALTLDCLWRKSRRAPVPQVDRGPFIRAQPQPCASVSEPTWLESRVDGPSVKAN